MSTTDMTVAKTILAQLGGNKFVAMTGARNFVGSDNGLSFRLPGSGFCNQGINAVHILLNGNDLYDVTYIKTRGSKVTVVEESKNIYFDFLRRSFTSVTGLETSL